jgi:DNA-directed RNA polymerase subunit E'/Rpb7
MSNNIFNTNILNTSIQLFPGEFNNSIDDSLLNKLKNKVEGKCDKNGYIKPNSAEIIRRSMGKVLQGHFNGSCSYKISYKVDICNPVEGMMVKVIVKNMNKMGLFCELPDIEPSPLTIILAKQHHLRNEVFEKVKINDVINVEIVGIKFNYNDIQISCIGRLSDNGKTLEENTEYNDYEDDEDYEEEEMDLGDEDDEDLEDASNDADEEDDAEEKQVGGNKSDIISMVGGKIKKDAELDGDELDDELDGDELDDELDGEDDELDDELEIDNLEENLELNLVDLSKGENTNSNMDLEDELGLEFEGEALDLDAFSRKDTEPLFLNENYERPRKLSEDVFNKEARLNKSYAPFIKKPSNKINYHIYLILSDLLIDFYEKYGVKPKKISLSTRNKYYKSIRNYVKINASSYEIEENDHRTFIC